MAHDGPKQNLWSAKGRAKALAARLSALRPKVSGGKLDLDQVEALLTRIENIPRRAAVAARLNALAERMAEDSAVTPEQRDVVAKAAEMATKYYMASTRDVESFEAEAAEWEQHYAAQTQENA